MIALTQWIFRKLVICKAELPAKTKHKYVKSTAVAEDNGNRRPYTVSYDSITVSYAREFLSVSMPYSQGGGFNTSLSRLIYCTYEKFFTVNGCLP